jgi:hypothetical protein
VFSCSATLFAIAILESSFNSLISDLRISILIYKYNIKIKAKRRNRKRNVYSLMHD